jgi:competence protein ComGC
MHPCLRRAITLIELLVVVTIIVILLALLAPGLDRAIEAAARARCAANQHVFGVAHPSYAMDHRRKMMTQPRHYTSAGSLSGVDGGIPYGMMPWLYNDTKPPEFSVEGIAPYIGQRIGNRIDGPWLCPSSSMTEIRANNEVFYNQPRNSGPQGTPQGPSGALDDGWYTYSEYVYFGAARQLGPGFSSRPELLSDGKIGGGVLMADLAFKHNGEFLWYNHGEYMRDNPPDGTPKIDGFNRMTADGAVGWIGVSPTRAKALWLDGLDGSDGANMGDYFSHAGYTVDHKPNAGDLFSLY